MENNLVILANAQKIAYSRGTEKSLPLPQISAVKYIVSVINATPGALSIAAAAINATTNIFTSVAHGLALGTVVRITAVGTIPGGLSSSLDYFVRPLTDDTFQLVDTLGHLLNDAPAIDLTNVGVGSNTYTPTSVAGVTARRRGSVDGVTFADELDTTQTISSFPATLAFETLNALAAYEEIYFGLTSGVLNVTVKAVVK